MENRKANSDIGFVGLLSIVFIVLKLCHVISWPWVLVLAPIWIDAIVLFALYLTLVIIGMKK